MAHQVSSLPGNRSRTLSPSLILHSARSPFQLFGLLLVVAMLAALVSLTNLVARYPSQLAYTQAIILPTSHTPYPFLSRPELVHLRSTYASHFDLGNGRRLAVVGATPLNYQDAEGNWQPIQPNFTALEDGWRVVHNSLRSTFAGDSTAFHVESGGQVFGWQPLSLEINDSTGGAWRLAVPQPGSTVQAEGLGSLLRYAHAWSDDTLVEQFESGADKLEQELILATAPEAAGEGTWLSLRVDLALPSGVLIVANGQSQTGEFTTHGTVQFQQADGTPLLALASPQAYEQGNRSVAVGGRYRAVPHGDGLTLWVQTPLAWWLAAERSYPAVLDPTMQVLHAMEAATIGYPYDVTDPNAGVAQQACVGLHDQMPAAGAWDPDSKWSDRGYVKFKLPNLPDGAVLTQAMLVGAPDPSRLTFMFHPGQNEDTLVYRVTQDWSFLQGVTTVPTTTVIAHAATETDRAKIPYVFSSDFDPDKRPVTTWDVTADVQMWYDDPDSNHGFALISEHDGAHLDEYIEEFPTFFLHCFPTASMVDLNDVLANPSNPTTQHAGLGLLIEYTSPQLAANEMRTVLVPSAVPGDAYLHQHHEYDPPTPSGWQLMAARGQRVGKIAQARLQLTQTVPTDPDLKGLISDAGIAAPGNEAYGFKSNYVVVNGHKSLPTDLRLHVLPDTFATDLPDDDRKYHLQIADAIPSPTMPPVGISTTLPIPLGNGFVAGQELDLAVSTTVEIKVPFGDLPPHMFNLQLFPPSLKYGSRQVPGIQLTEGPDAWEIEIVINPGQEGTWLLAAINDGLYSTPGPTLEAQVVACENSPGVTQYPVDGVCVELQTPPTPVPSDPSVLYQHGNVRIYSPLGFTDDCSDGTCTTVAVDGEGQAVAALIGYVGDDDNWVALKGGQFEILNNVVNTTPDVRLIMAQFHQEPLPITLPVLRGQFQVNNSTGLMSSIGTDLYPLVKAPLPEDDMDNGWTFTVDLSQALMRAYGPLTRVVEPTEGMGQATFDFNAQWSITARGGQDLAGGAILSNSPGSFNVGTLIVEPPLGSDYTLEHNPTDALPGIPQAIPEFKHIRLTGATLKQPTDLGGAQVPVQAVILPPGTSVVDPEDPGLILYCGTAKTCFDLRGETDAMEPAGPHTVRQYRMPDLIIQDQAGTVMINMPQGVEIYSRDHPESRLGLDGGGYSFSYEAFGATIRTYQGVCPLPRNPLDPTEILPGTAKTTTVVEGEATMSLPNAESTSGGPQISVSFRLCEDSLREMSFSFYTGDQTALPLGNSGLFLNLVGGIISLAPQQGPEPGYTTVALEVGVRGMSPDTLSSNVFVRGVVTIDTRGLFDMQLQAGLKVVGGYGVGVDGHFWVAWAPLDLGFEVQACAPYSEGFDAVSWPLYGKRCDGNELLFGSLRAHLWQGQGWQHQYNWLPDNDDVHIAAKYSVNINIAAGMIIDWEFVVIPPEDIQLYGITLAFGEFCTNQACTSYEWGVTGAYTLMGYDFGIYYGFDSGLDFIVGSADYLLIDEAGGAFSAGPTLDYVGAEAGSPYTVTIPPSTPSAMFALGWDPGTPPLEMDLTLQSPNGTIIDQSTSYPTTTLTVSPTLNGQQIVIVIEDPTPGEWHIYTTGSEPLPQHRFVYMANKPEPSLTLADIPEIIGPGDVIEIEWESNIDPQDTAWLSLYYTTTNAIMTSAQEIGGPIVERLPLTPHGTYEWHVQGLAYVDNDYHIFARIDSEATAEINGCGGSYAYNPDPTSGEASCAMLNSKLVLPAAHITDLATFWYEDWIAPAAPVLVGAQAVDWTSIMVLWEPNAEVDLAGYLVRCEQTGLVRTVRVPAQHMTGTLEYESAQVNGLLPYENTPATCSLRAYDTSGNVSGDSSNAMIVMPGGVVSEATISPENGATLISVDNKVTTVFPAGLVEGDTLIKLTKRTLPPHPIGPLEYAGTAFDLSAYGPNGIPVTQFLGDFTLNVGYGELGLQAAGAGAEEQLNLYWWDGGTWQGLLPCNGCSHDIEGQRFIVVLDHLTEFAVLAGQPPHSSRLYLPLIMKAE
jgi:hypothetical protein